MTRILEVARFESHFGWATDKRVVGRSTAKSQDGLQALKQIMTLDPKANVIMVTALGQETLVLDAVKAGAREFVIKPFKPNELVRAIEKTLA